LLYVSVEFVGSRVTQAPQPFDFFQEFKYLWPKLVVPAQVCHSIRELSRPNSVDFRKDKKH
jgi:hypothetical protein